MIGRYILALAITAPVILFFELKLREVQASDANDRHQFGDYFALRSFTVALALLLIAGIALSSGFSRQAIAVILAVGVCKAMESISDILFGLMQKHEKMQYIAVSLMLKGLLSLGALSVVLYLFQNLFSAVAAMLGVSEQRASWVLEKARPTQRHRPAPHGAMSMTSISAVASPP